MVPFYLDLSRPLFMTPSQDTQGSTGRPTRVVRVA